MRRSENAFAPFCSGRCKTVDLGRWLSGDYVITAQDDHPDETTQLAAAALGMPPSGDA